MVELGLARSELILGGQKSGKSRRAEALAQRWLTMRASHRAVLIATATAGDNEMRQRIARHQQDRAERLVGMQLIEAPVSLAEAICHHSAPETLIVVDCLTLWLTHLLMPIDGPSSEEAKPFSLDETVTLLVEAIAAAPGPVVLVGNEIGLGVIPLGSEVRAFVDALGLLNQRVAAICERVTLMAAGLPMTLKQATA